MTDIKKPIAPVKGLSADATDDMTEICKSEAKDTAYSGTVNPLTHDFVGMNAAGFRDLLPIIPPDATISSYSHTLHGRDGVLGKLPGKRVSDGWVGFAGWEDYQPTEDDLYDWAESGAGVGLRCADVVAVDIDVTDEGLAEMIEGMAYTELGMAPCRTGNAPKRLLLYRQASRDMWLTKRVVSFRVGDTSHAIELLGSRQQFVVDGVHPKTGRRYVWDSHPMASGIDSLPVLTEAELVAFIESLTGTLDMLGYPVNTTTGRGAEDRAPERLRCGDLGLLARAVAAIPNPEDTTREEFVQMAHAIRAAADDDPDVGLGIFTEWADRWPLGQADGEVERVYWSVRGASLGVQWLMEKAAAHGWTGALQADFELPDSAFEYTTPADEDLGSEGFWNEWVYVNRIKRFVHRSSRVQLDKEQFNDKVGKVDKQKAADFFIEHRPASSWADDVDYRPGEFTDITTTHNGLKGFNMWRPGPAYLLDKQDTPVTEQDLGPWLELGRHLFPDAEKRGTLIKWMASLLQNPGQKPNWHPLIGSAVHGTGKDSFFEPLRLGLGRNVTTIRTGDLEGQWTWWAENTQLVIVSEISSFERRGVMQKMKSYMASPPEFIDINKKGVPQYEVPNLFGMVMFTNREDGVAVEKHDRRFYVLWSEAGRLSEDWFERYHAWVRQGGMQVVCRYLMELDLTGFSTRGNAPTTEEKETMRLAAAPVGEAALCESIDAEEGLFAADVVSTADVLPWLKAQVGRAVSATTCGIWLRSAGAVRLGQVRDGAERLTLWSVRRHLMYQGLQPQKLVQLYHKGREGTGVPDDFTQAMMQ